MSAIPEDFIQKTAKLSDEVTQPFTASKKIYVEGSRPDIRVPMREVEVTDTHTDNGIEENANIEKKRPIIIVASSMSMPVANMRFDPIKTIPDDTENGVSPMKLKGSTIHLALPSLTTDLISSWKANASDPIEWGVYGKERDKTKTSDRIKNMICSLFSFVINPPNYTS